MKLAFSTLGCPDWSVAEVIEAARCWGYGGVELRLLGADLIPADLPPAERAQLRAQFEAAGVAIVCVATSARFSAADPETRADNERLAERYLELAADLGSPMIRVFGGHFPEGVAGDDVIAYVAESLERVGRRGEALGVTTVLETHDGFSAGATVAATLARVSSPAVGALWDTHHPYRMGETPQQTWDYIGERMVHTRVKDAVRKPDGGWQLVLLGQGEVPVKEAMSIWAQRGYAGFVCVEWEKKWHPEIEEPEVAFPQHIQVLREYLAAITAAPDVSAGPS